MKSDSNSGYFTAQLWDTQDGDAGRISISSGSNLGLSGKHSVAIVLFDITTIPSAAIYLDSYMAAHDNAYLSKGSN